MIFIALICVFILFVFVVLIGAPYLPTLGSQQRSALQLLTLKKGQTVMDLGSGDGRFLREAAKQGYKAVGIEANPILVCVSYIVCLPYRSNVTILWGNMWTKKWPKVDAVYVFLHTRFMQKLDKKLEQQYSGKNVNVVSYAFEIPGKKVVKTENGLFLYKY
jgi:16S rRNA A1518/A1519 N6-dimethyltransferase RsmA/KsgA/DIM1 with predicted DNA glycosylase/AP lyase activity